MNNRQIITDHIYRIMVIHWISYQPFEQPGPGIHIFWSCQLNILIKYHNFLSMNISKYKLYKNGKYTYVYNGFISVVSCLIKYSVIIFKKAEKYRP